MSETVLETAWSKVRNGKDLEPEESKAITDDERAKAIKAGAVFK